MKRFVLFALGLLLCIGCEQSEKDLDAEVLERVAAFAEAYFNYDFEKALKMVTPDSEKWLRFAASNVTQEDVDLLNAQEGVATVDAEGYERLNDSTLAVRLTVRDFLTKDSLGAAGRIEAEGQFRFVAIRQDKSFLVRMEGLPRSERQSRD